ncbi:hypothetical protein [Portibacter lacus]|uniref:Uncharacterized protein n=1 Tax=Portibacter lacus TaxID=1099794 RepID=A0AA37SMB4_9BACT|nr:hypothetical protein [Portibacter lacus]GLR16009.1 hypothetical protein GCM10007940_06240 [Portibacter lacus]
MIFRIALIFFLSLILKAEAKGNKQTYESAEALANFDSIIDVKIIELNNSIDTKITQLKEAKIDLLNTENLYFKEKATWHLTVLAILFAILPISIGFIEFFKHRLAKKYRELQEKLSQLESKTSPLNRMMEYNSLYIIHAIKPIIEELIDKVGTSYTSDIEKENDLDRVYQIFFDNEKCVNLFSTDLVEVNSSKQYLKNNGNADTVILLEIFKDRSKDTSVLKDIDDILGVIRRRVKNMTTNS